LAADVLRQVVQIGNDLLFAYFIVLNSAYLVLIGLAFADFTRNQRRRGFSGADDLFRNPLAPAVSLIVPAHNEGPVIIAAVHALSALRYPRFEVVVVDDGSTDDTFERLHAEFDLVEIPYVMPHEVPHRGELLSVYAARNAPDKLLVARKRNGGKADALNVGINLARHELICMVDADSILDHDALLSVVKPFADDPSRVVATGGVVGIANGCRVTGGRIVDVRMPRRWLTRIQVVEYLRAFLTGRTGWSRIGGLVVISGAFGLFRRDILVRVGGMALDTVGEDAEIVVRIHRRLREDGYDYRVVFVAETISWSQAPSALPELGRQRRRWHRGLAELLRTHRTMIGNPRYGRIGLVALPYYLVFELLAPFVELLAVLLLPLGLLVGAVDVSFAWRFLLAAYGYGIIVGLAALVLEEISFHRYRRWQDVTLGFFAVVAENLGYRQVLAPYQVRGVWQAWRGREASWGVIARTSFEQSSKGGS
jgi:cellulose synthase/poly-beta-1,6-N-acetylglucosamine synthase-like glycosyltransferase